MKNFLDKDEGIVVEMHGLNKMTKINWWKNIR